MKAHSLRLSICACLNHVTVSEMTPTIFLKRLICISFAWQISNTSAILCGIQVCNNSDYLIALACFCCPPGNLTHRKSYRVFTYRQLDPPTRPHVPAALSFFFFFLTVTILLYSNKSYSNVLFNVSKQFKSGFLFIAAGDV